MLVRSELSSEGGGAHLNLLVEDLRSRAVLAVFELPMSAGGQPESDGRGRERGGGRAGAGAGWSGAGARRPVLRLPGAPDAGSLAAAQAFRDGVRLAERSRNQEARGAFERALAADPAFWPAPIYLALLAKANARFDEAHAQIARLREMLPQPGATEAVIVEAASAYVAEDNQRQLEALQRALDLFPGSGYLAYRTAQSLRMQDRPDEAIPLLEAAARAQLAARLEPNPRGAGPLPASCGALRGRAPDLSGRGGALPHPTPLPVPDGLRPAAARTLARGAPGAGHRHPQVPRPLRHGAARRPPDRGVLGRAAALARGAGPAVGERPWPRRSGGCGRRRTTRTFGWRAARRWWDWVVSTRPGRSWSRW